LYSKIRRGVNARSRQKSPSFRKRTDRSGAAEAAESPPIVALRSRKTTLVSSPNRPLTTALFAGSGATRGERDQIDDQRSTSPSIWVESSSAEGYCRKVIVRPAACRSRRSAQAPPADNGGCRGPRPGKRAIYGLRQSAERSLARGNSPQSDSTPANRSGWFIATRKAIVPPYRSPRERPFGREWYFSAAASMLSKIALFGR